MKRTVTYIVIFMVLGVIFYFNTKKEDNTLVDINDENQVEVVESESQSDDTLVSKTSLQRKKSNSNVSNKLVQQEDFSSFTKEELAERYVDKSGIKKSFSKFKRMIGKQLKDRLSATQNEKIKERARKLYGIAAEEINKDSILEDVKEEIAKDLSKEELVEYAKLQQDPVFAKADQAIKKLSDPNISKEFLSFMKTGKVDQEKLELIKQLDKVGNKGTSVLFLEPLISKTMLYGNYLASGNDEENARKKAEEFTRVAKELSFTPKYMKNYYKYKYFSLRDLNKNEIRRLINLNERPVMRRVFETTQDTINNRLEKAGPRIGERLKQALQQG